MPGRRRSLIVAFGLGLRASCAASCARPLKGAGAWLFLFRVVCSGVALSVGGPTGEARPPTAEVLASALLAACNGDSTVAIRLLRRTRDVLLKTQGAGPSEGPSWPQP